MFCTIILHEDAAFTVTSYCAVDLQVQWNLRITDPLVPSVASFTYGKVLLKIGHLLERGVKSRNFDVPKYNLHPRANSRASTVRTDT